jgi:hypothetical protein
MKLMNNLLFGSPVMLLLAMFTLTQMSNFGDATVYLSPNLQSIVGMFLGLTFIFSLLSVVIVFINRFISKKNPDAPIGVGFTGFDFESIVKVCMVLGGIIFFILLITFMTKSKSNVKSAKSIDVSKESKKDSLPNLK